MTYRRNLAQRLDHDTIIGPPVPTWVIDACDLAVLDGARASDNPEAYLRGAVKAMRFWMRGLEGFEAERYEYLHRRLHE